MFRIDFKRVLLVLVNISFVFCVSAQRKGEHIISVLHSEIKIQGETNVNKFECELFIPTITDTITVNSIRSTLKISFDSLILSYRVDDFDCGISAMTKDFQDLLNADQFPYLNLKINEINILKENEGFERLAVIADITVTIGGVSKRLKVKDSYVINESESVLTLYGEESVNITDFGIEPPTRFWGALRVYDKLRINFNIRMNTKKG